MTGGSATTGGSGPAGGSVAIGGAGAGPLDGGNELACAPLIQPIEGARLWQLEEYTCCLEYVGAQLEYGWPQNIPRLAADPSLVNCCRYITKSYYDLRYDDAGAPPPYPAIERDVCCSDGVLTPDETFGGFCAPWGPPVPPALEVA
jgi:hypothetical protein